MALTRKQNINDLKRAVRAHQKKVETSKRRLKRGNSKPNQSRTKKRNRRRIQAGSTSEYEGGGLDANAGETQEEPIESTGGEGLGEDSEPSLPDRLGSEQPRVEPFGGNIPLYNRAVGEPFIVSQKVIKPPSNPVGPPGASMYPTKPYTVTTYGKKIVREKKKR